MKLVAMDSIGKCSSGCYCTAVCDERGWLPPIYMPGASLVEIIEKVVDCPHSYHTLCIISMANKVVDMDWKFYEETTRTEVRRAITTLANHIKDKRVSKHLILFGADVALFEGAANPEAYRLIQNDTLDMLRSVGLNVGTGMEIEYGNFGQFKDKLDEMWHIRGSHRDEAVAFLGKVLAATSLRPTSSTSSFIAHGGVTTVSFPQDSHSDAIAASSEVGGLLSSSSSVGIVAGLGNEPSLSYFSGGPSNWTNFNIVTAPPQQPPSWTSGSTASTNANMPDDMFHAHEGETMQRWEGGVFCAYCNLCKKWSDAGHRRTQKHQNNLCWFRQQDSHSDAIAASSEVGGLLSSSSSVGIVAGLGNEPSLSYFSGGPSNWTNFNIVTAPPQQPPSWTSGSTASTNANMPDDMFHAHEGETMQRWEGGVFCAYCNLCKKWSDAGHRRTQKHQNNLCWFRQQSPESES